MRRDPARHPDHHPGVALPDALLGGPRDPHRGRGGDRRRDPRRRPDQARLPPRADPGATRPPGRSSAEEDRPAIQRIGLSATQRPLERIARFLVGPERECQIVDAGQTQGSSTCEIVVPVEDMDRATGVAAGPPAASDGSSRRRSASPAPDVSARSGRRSTRSCCELVQEHTSTIVFVNNRRGAERLAKRLNELANDEELMRGHPATERRRPTTPTGEPRSRSRSPAPTTARSPTRSAPSSRSCSSRAAPLPGRDLVAGAGNRHGRGRPGDPGRVAEVGHPRPAADRPRRPRPRRGLEGPDLPQVPRRPARVRRGRPAHARRRDRGDGDPRRTRSTCSPSTSSRWRRSTSGRSTRPSAWSTATEPFRELSREQLENVLDMLDGRYPSDRFAELRPRIVWDRTDGTIARPQGRPPAGRHQRRHDPRPRPLRRPPARRPPGRRARRGDGLRGPARPDLPARRLDLADRGDHPRPGDRHPGAGGPRGGPVLARRRDRPAGRARQGDRRLRPRGGRRATRASWRASTTSTSAPPRTSSPTCASSRTRPAWSPPTRRSWSSASATRSATGASASSRPTAAGSTPPGAWRSPRRSATSATSRPTRSGPTTASSSTCPTPTSRPPPTWS